MRVIHVIIFRICCLPRFRRDLYDLFPWRVDGLLEVELILEVGYVGLLLRELFGYFGECSLVTLLLGFNGLRLLDLLLHEDGVFLLLSHVVLLVELL
jgi:hypothetical protein